MRDVHGTHGINFSLIIKTYNEYRLRNLWQEGLSERGSFYYIRVSMESLAYPKSVMHSIIYPLGGGCGG